MAERSITIGPHRDPATRLNMNDSTPATIGARRQRKAQQRAWREAGWAYGSNLRGRSAAERGLPCRVQLTLGTDRPNQRRDPSNWISTAKHLVDGLTDTRRYWPDDDSRYVTILEPIFTDRIPKNTWMLTLTWEDA